MKNNNISILEILESVAKENKVRYIMFNLKKYIICIFKCNA
jgi:hypothetical protein